MEQFSRPQPSPEDSLDATTPHAANPPTIGAFAAPDPAAVHQAPVAVAAPSASAHAPTIPTAPPPAPVPGLAESTPAPPTVIAVAESSSPSNRPRRGILVAGMAAMTVAAVAGGAFLVTRDSDDSVIVEDATELATDPNVESTAGYSFAAATATAQAAASVVFDMEIDSPDGPMSATASFDRASGRTAMELDMSRLTAEDEFFEVGDSLSFIIDEPDQVAYVNADFFAALFGSTDAGWISLTGDEFTIEDDVFGDVLTNPLNIAEVFGDVEPIDLGEETIDGEVLRHFQVVLDDAAIADLGGSGVVNEEFAQAEIDLTYDVWVDESNQIRRILFDAMDQGEVGSVDMWITVSGDPIDIAIPAAGDVVDLEELFSAAFEDFDVDASFDTEED